MQVLLVEWLSYNREHVFLYYQSVHLASNCNCCCQCKVMLYSGWW